MSGRAPVTLFSRQTAAPDSTVSGVMGPSTDEFGFHTPVFPEPHPRAHRLWGCFRVRLQHPMGAYWFPNEDLRVPGHVPGSVGPSFPRAQHSRRWPL